MLVKRTDLPAGFQPQLSSGADPHTDCAASVGEADLTLSGDAEGQQLALGGLFVSSAAQVYESVADASASWRRATSAPGTKCATELLRREFAKQGVDLVSLRKVAFPRVAERSVAYRVTLSANDGAGQAAGVCRSRRHDALACTGNRDRRVRARPAPEGRGAAARSHRRGSHGDRDARARPCFRPATREATSAMPAPDRPGKAVERSRSRW